MRRTAARSSVAGLGGLVGAVSVTVLGALLGAGLGFLALFPLAWLFPDAPDLKVLVIEGGGALGAAAALGISRFRRRAGADVRQ